MLNRRVRRSFSTSLLPQGSSRRQARSSPLRSLINGSQLRLSMPRLPVNRNLFRFSRCRCRTNRNRLRPNRSRRLLKRRQTQSFLTRCPLKGRRLRFRQFLRLPNHRMLRFNQFPLRLGECLLQLIRPPRHLERPRLLLGQSPLLHEVRKSRLFQSLRLANGRGPR